MDAGLDPAQQKRLAKLTAAAQQANTFEALAGEFLDKKRGEGKADTTLSKLEWLIGIAKPTLGARPITEIAAPEILQVLRGVEARERRESAKRLRAVIGSIFRYAIATGRASNDPTAALKGALMSPIVRHRAAIVDPENTLNAASRRLGYAKDEMTAHGFRAAASSILNESGIWNPDAIEAQLAHVEGNSVRRAYARAEFWDEFSFVWAHLDG